MHKHTALYIPTYVQCSAVSIHIHTVMYFVFGTWQLGSKHELFYLFALTLFAFIIIVPCKMKSDKIHMTRVLLMCVV